MSPLSFRCARVSALINLRSTRMLLSTASGDTSPMAQTLVGTVAPHRCYIFIHASDPPASFPAKISTHVQRALQLKVMKWGGIVNFSWMEPNKKGNRQAATAFSALGGRLDIPEITLENLDEVEENLQSHVSGPLERRTSDEIHLYVCTHGARDCRCGDMGSQVAKALREEVARRVELDPQGLISRVRVGEVGHVGGHKLSKSYD